MLAGCGSDASSAQGSSSKSAESSNNDSYTVKILAPGDASTDDCAKISEAASKITEEKILIQKLKCNKSWLWKHMISR